MTDTFHSDQISKKDRDRIVHISLPNTENIVLIASDIILSMRHTSILGNKCYVSLNLVSQEEADNMFKRISESTEVKTAIEDQFRGDYVSSFIDKFGI